VRTIKTTKKAKQWILTLVLVGLLIATPILFSMSADQQSFAQNDDNQQDNGEKPQPQLILNQIPDVAQEGNFTLSGKLEFQGVGLSGRNITFTENIPGVSLPSVTTGEIVFEHTNANGMMILECEKCANDDPSLRGKSGVPPNKVLYMKMGGTITFPAGTYGVTLELQDIAWNYVEFNVKRNDGFSYNVTSEGRGDNIALFSLMDSEGIRTIKVLRMVEKWEGPSDMNSKIGISAMRTFDPLGNPQFQRRIDFEEFPVDGTPNPLIIGAGLFFVTSYIPLDVSVGTELTVTAHFAGELGDLDPADSNPQNFIVFEISLSSNNSAAGTGGEGTSVPTSYSGTFYRTGTGCATDSDNDAICDDWETNGLQYKTWDDSLVRYSLCHKDAFSDAWNGTPVNKWVCPKPLHKDVFVELDYMTGHAPKHSAVVDVKRAFENATVVTNGAVDSFNNLTGVTLHVLQDVPAVPIHHTDNLNVWRDPGSVPFDTNATNDFVSLKYDNFGNSTERIASFSTSGGRTGPTWSNVGDPSCTSSTTADF
jgi:hypothetical protein